RTKNNRELFERGPKLAIENENYTDTTDFDAKAATLYRMRHPALHLRDHELDIYYSNVGDTPERIKRTTIDLRSDWTEWRGSAPEEILRTENDYEGLDLPDEPSTGGSSHIRVHQVRDPYLYTENDRKYLVYSTAGETGLGIAELIDE
ncbi:MAG: hypothetical protein QGG64_15580, partial [Candidatus Latescibacteria bacterium]|nr:hypothetical protein [Candidatus Latescibacterota bacterium]